MKNTLRTINRLSLILVAMNLSLLNAADKLADVSYEFMNKTGETIKIVLNDVSQKKAELYNNQSQTLTSKAAVESFKITFGSYQKTFSATDSKLGLPVQEINGKKFFTAFKATVSKDKKNKEKLEFSVAK